MMEPLYSSSSLQMSVYFLVVLTACSTKECTLKMAEKLKDRSAFLTKTDIKLFQIECMEDLCRQSHDESKTIEKMDGSSVHQENEPQVLTEHCRSVICNQTSKCLKRGCTASCVEVPSLCDLHGASDAGDLSTLNLILSQGRADINCQEWIGRTPVIWAAGKGYRDVVELLVSKDANVSLVDRFGINVLHSACLGGDVEVVKYVLSQKMVDINSRVRCGRTPVMLAAENGHEGVVEFLVGKGADVSLVDKRRDSILHCACRGGDVEVVKYILSLHEVAINTRGWRKMTPVMVAGHSGHKQVVELLVKHGANLSLRESAGYNILHLACFQGQADVVKYVLSQHAVDINSRGWKKMTPVMVAGHSGHKQVVELLVKHGANLSLRESAGYNILHLACFQGQADVVKYVLSQHVVDINSRGWKKRTPVMVAGNSGHKQVVDLLVKHGVNMAVTGNDGNNILHLACSQGQADVVKYVLSQHVVDINSRGWKKRTPVMVAGHSGHKQVVELLVKHGANMAVTGNDGNNILHLACSQGQADVVKYVLSQQVVDINSKGWKKRTPVMVAGRNGHKQVVELLLKHGAYLSLRESAGYNILHLACSQGQADVVKYVLSRHVVDINSRGWKKRTPVMVAGQNGHKEVVELLVKHGANLSLRDSDENNILRLACSQGQVDVVMYVLSRHVVDINSRGWKKRTPVMVAGQNGHKQVVELLVKHGANMTVTGNDGNNILHLACSQGQADVVKYVLSQHVVDINSRGWKKRTPVMVAGHSGHKQVVELLVKHGANMTVTSNDGNNILHLACSQGQVDVVKYILSQHIVVDINSRGWKKRTPVMVAGHSGHKQVVELLVKHGANLSLRDSDGNNILHLACSHGQVDVVKYIVLLNKVDINSRGEGRKTPVMVAQTTGHKQVVELLVKHGSSV